MDETQEAQLQKELTLDEGKRNKVYKDTEGNDTVGIGHLVAKGFSDAVISLIFKEDITEAESFLNRNLPWWTEMSAIRQRVILNMAFNMGPRLLTFKNTLASMKAGDYTAAAAGMKASKWYGQVGKRAKRLCYMMENDKVPPQTAEFY